MRKMLIMSGLCVLLLGSLACSLLAGKADLTESPAADLAVTAGAESATETTAPQAEPTAAETSAPLPTASSTSVPTAIPTPEPTSPPAAGDTRLRELDGMSMAYVPQGEFMMGSDKYDIEDPVHRVTLDAYWIDIFEVSNAQYALCEAAGSCTAPFSKRTQTIKDYYLNPDYGNYPMVNIDWYQAQAYCEWAGGRLPTEAEWEKAARGSDERTYPWGDSEPNADLLNYNDYVGDVVAVGSYRMGISPYGVHDMAGNVKEWVADRWGSNYYEVSPSENPTGPETGTTRVVRNGCYGHPGDFNRAAYRNYFVPENSGNFLGFRCVTDAVEP